VAVIGESLKSSVLERSLGAVTGESRDNPAKDSIGRATSGEWSIGAASALRL
jgi:hypothetical protein